MTALDTLSRMGFPADDPGVRRGLAWFVDHQGPDGLWEHGGLGPRARPMKCWVALAACRVFRRFHGEPDQPQLRPGSTAG